MKCIVLGCENAQKYKPENISFHRFPTDLSRKNEWITALKLNNRKLAQRAVVCCKHFKSEDFSINSKRLNPSAVPYFVEDLNAVSPYNAGEGDGVAITRTERTNSPTVNARSVAAVKIPRTVVPINCNKVSKIPWPGSAACIPRVERKVQLGSVQNPGMVTKPTGHIAIATSYLPTATLQMAKISRDSTTAFPLKATANSIRGAATPPCTTVTPLKTTSNPLKATPTLQMIVPRSLRTTSSAIRIMPIPKRITTPLQITGPIPQMKIHSPRMTTPPPSDPEPTFDTADASCQTGVPLDKSCETEIYCCNRKIKLLEMQNNKLEKRINYINTLETKMSKIFTCSQIQKLKDPDKEIRWMENDKAIPSHLYRTSPKVYQHLYDKGYPLPQTTTVIEWLMDEIAKTTKSTVPVSTQEEIDSILINDNESVEMMTNEIKDEIETYETMDHEMIDPAINTIETNGDDDVKLEEICEEEMCEKILGY